MKSQSIFLYLLFFIPIFAISQTKIYLTPPQNRLDDYHFVNISDSIFVKMSYSEDMGHKYGQRYELKTEIPNGEYMVYVNDTLNLHAFIKDFKRDGSWKTYYKNGNLQGDISYRLGEMDGVMKFYYNDGQIKFEGVNKEDKPVGTRNSYYQSGEIYKKDYYENGVFVKQEVFDRNGTITKIINH